MLRLASPNYSKMIALIGLLAVYSLTCNVDCVPLQSELSQMESAETGNQVNSEPKMEKRSYLNLYQSEITQTLPGQKITNNLNDDGQSNFNENNKSEQDAVNLNPLEIIRELSKHKQRHCSVGTQRRDLCERCAKVTKSEMAYVYCCIDKDNVHAFCEKFIDYSLID